MVGADRAARLPPPRGQLASKVAAPSSTVSFRTSADNVDALLDMGVVSSRDDAVAALAANRNSVERTMDSIFDKRPKKCASPSHSTHAGCPAGWGGLRPPSARDIAPRKIAKGLSSGPPPFTHLVVLDFEWTCDNKRLVHPCSEITQFPAVLVRLAGRASHVVDEFDTFVRPTLNPVLSAFATELTGITQADVDAAKPLDDALRRFLGWLEGHGLITSSGIGGTMSRRSCSSSSSVSADGDGDGRGAKLGHWAICTWTDADIGGQLSRETKYKGLAMPLCFSAWIDLKKVFLRHYKRRPTGGLQRCVESLGLEFEGRPHNGLIDSRNTAKIVVHMASGSPENSAFVFSKTTVSY